jgi:hypothetical protein
MRELGAFLKVFMAPFHLLGLGGGTTPALAFLTTQRGQFLRKQKGQQAPF